MEYSMSSDKGIITTSSLSSSSRSASPSSSSSSPSTNYPPSPPAAVTSPPPSSSSSSSPDSPPPDLPPAAVTLSPSYSHSAVLPALAVVMINSCVACKYLGWSCEGNCVLATCFAPNDLLKFSAVHRVFGARNIIKFLQELPEYQRADAVSSMVYEANARLRDPVYGCAGTICQLQRHVNDLQAQLAKAQAEIVNMQCQQANLVALVCTESPQQSLDNFTNIGMSFLDDFNNSGALWEPLWT